VNRRTLLRFLVLHGIAAADPAPGSPPPPATPDPFAGVSSKKGLQVQMTTMRSPWVCGTRGSTSISVN
jgi:hypothetical protein